jgi:valyl-tRNA synthetase
MAKNSFDFKSVEDKWLKFWEKQGIYKFDTKSKKKIFSVDTPPPTISGRLHMGHAFGDSQQDFFVRFKRMQGFNVLNPFGTDNNGLPTLKLVEKEKGVRSKNMKREKFIELCIKTIEEEYIPQFLNDAKQLGISADWDLFYSTIDKNSRRISQKSFIELYKKGREYRVEAPMMICPNCQTAIAQVEMEDAELESQLCYIRVKVETGNELVFATTRPELLPACVGISVHPDDKRYKKLIGKKVKLPLVDREVVLSADSETDPEYGSGVVYYCTYGGAECVEWLTRHPDVEPIHIMGLEGVYNEKAGKYEGMNSHEAREEILKDLKKAGALVKTEKLKHFVNVHERCGTEIEYVATKQWFVKYLDLKKDMLKWGKQIKWYPEYMRSRYDNWVKGLKWDWCISRQIAFGIPFPVWYCAKCEEVVLAKEKDLPVDPVDSKPPIKKCAKCGSTEFIPEKDIMNTWVTSSLTPTIVKELLKDTEIYSKIKNKPMSIRRNGHDIITFWDFTTIVKSQLHYGFNPWDELFINGWMLGSDGKKMAKSRGNGVAPQEVIAEWGADVLRYLSASSGIGEDLSFPEKELVAGKRFVNKLMNATKFVFMNLDDWKGSRPKKLEVLDELFLGKLNEIIKLSTENFEKYEYSKVKQDVEQFFWSDFCDYYLETVKKLVYNGKGSARLSAQYTLYLSLLTVLKLIAPITPFITEELYQEYFKRFEKDKSIHLSEWPKPGKEKYKEDWEVFKKNLFKMNQIKSQEHLSLNVASGALIVPTKDYKILKNYEERFLDVSGAQCIKAGKEFKADMSKVGTEVKEK